MLCQPSPKVISATQNEFFESSRVSKRREPHRCVAELISHVQWSPTTTRRNTPHSTQGQPPMASSTSPTTTSGTQCHLVSAR